MKLCYKADKALEKNGTNSDITKWNSKGDIQAYLKPLKNKDDAVLPSVREDLECVVLLWKHRVRKVTSCDSEVLRSFRLWIDEENNKKNRGNSKRRKRNSVPGNSD